MNGKCFACDRPLGKNPQLVQSAVDDQTMYVGSDCFKRVLASGDEGYQPPLGGPRLKVIPVSNPFSNTNRHPRNRHRGF